MSDPKYDKKYLKTFGQAQENIQPLEENVTKRKKNFSNSV